MKLSKSYIYFIVVLALFLAFLSVTSQNLFAPTTLSTAAFALIVVGLLLSLYKLFLSWNDSKKRNKMLIFVFVLLALFCYAYAFWCNVCQGSFVDNAINGVLSTDVQNLMLGLVIFLGLALAVQIYKFCCK